MLADPETLVSFVAAGPVVSNADCRKLQLTQVSLLQLLRQHLRIPEP